MSTATPENNAGFIPQLLAGIIGTKVQAKMAQLPKVVSADEALVNRIKNTYKDRIKFTNDPIKELNGFKIDDDNAAMISALDTPIIQMGANLKDRPAIMAHEVGHALDYYGKKLNRDKKTFFEKVLTGGDDPGYKAQLATVGTGLGSIANLLGGKKLGIGGSLGVGAGSFLMSTPQLWSELRGSKLGYDVMRDHGASIGQSLGAFAGVPSYMAFAGLPTAIAGGTIASRILKGAILKKASDASIDQGMLPTVGATLGVAAAQLGYTKALLENGKGADAGVTGKLVDWAKQKGIVIRNDYIPSTAYVSPNLTGGRYAKGIVNLLDKAVKPGILAHELGHAQELLGKEISSKPKLLDRIKSLGGNSAPMRVLGNFAAVPALASLSMDVSKETKKNLGHVGLALSTPVLASEARASINGYKLMRDVGKTGRLKALTSFLGLPTYLANAGVGYLPYLLDSRK